MGVRVYSKIKRFFADLTHRDSLNPMDDERDVDISSIIFSKIELGLTQISK